MKELELLRVFGEKLSAMEEDEITEELYKSAKIREYMLNDIGMSDCSERKIVYTFCKLHENELSNYYIMGEDLYKVSAVNLTHDPEEVAFIEKVDDGNICVYRGRFADGRWFWGVNIGFGEILNFCPFDWEWYEMCDITSDDVVGYTEKKLETLWEKTPENRRKFRDER